MDRGRGFCFGVSLLLGCGPSLGDGDGGMDGTGASAEDHGNDDDGPPPPPPPPSLGMGHGVVALELGRGHDEADDPFVGTTRVEATLLYRECLIDFYDANPDWLQVGVEGDIVFTTVVLENSLCEAMNPELADCTVTEIAQELGVTKSLTVAFDVTELLEHRQLHIGPLPSAQLADCPDGDYPIVRVGSSMSVLGFDASGTEIWATEAFSPAEAVTDQGAEIQIRVARI